MMRWALAVFIPVLIVHLVGNAREYWEGGFGARAWDAADGRRIFQARCVRCHAIGGAGATVGPNLSEVGAVASSRRPGMNAAQYLLESILQPTAFKAPGSSGEMPMHLVADLSDKQIRDLVGFLWMLGGDVSEAGLEALEVVHPPRPARSELVDGPAVLRGETIYRGKGGCIKCHPFYGFADSERVAPRLFGKGPRDPVRLRESILTPHRNVAERYAMTSVVMASGKTLVGQLIRRSEDSIVLLSYAEDAVQLVTVPVDDLETDESGEPIVLTKRVSAMPEGIGALLTPAELDDLIAFLLAAN